MDNHEITNNVPPTLPKTEGRKKIRIARIEDTRSRQVTFLKRKNGLLKKAMELGILCDCEVAVIIFNTSNGKLFEYSSVETEKVLQRYATYSGPSERRKKETFFDLSKSKGTSNIPLNEPVLAEAAMNAAAAAVRRPRPTYKFSTSEEQEANQEYGSSGRKLSSGESPVGPYAPPPVHIQTPSIATNYDQVAKRQKLAQTFPPSGPGLPNSGVVPPIQLPDHVSGRPSFMPFTPRFSASLPFPAITPNTASRHISAAFGLQDPTPKMSGLTPISSYTRNPFHVPQQTHEQHTTEVARHQHYNPEHLSAQTDGTSRPNQPIEYQIPTHSQPPSATDENSIKPEDPPQIERDSKIEQYGNVGVAQDVNVDHSMDVKTEARPAARAKPNLRVQISNPNRDDFVVGTPSGLNSLTTPSSGDDNGHMSFQIPRLNTSITSPTANSAWHGWHNGDRDGPMPLTPFLNMDTLAGPSDVGNGQLHLALPSPTDAGLIPLTPRGFGLDSLLSARPSTRSQDASKRPFDSNFDQNRSVDPKRPFA